MASSASGQGRLAQPGEVAVQAQDRRVAGDQVQVGGAGVGGVGQPAAQPLRDRGWVGHGRPRGGGWWHARGGAMRAL